MSYRTAVASSTHLQGDEAAPGFAILTHCMVETFRFDMEAVCTVNSYGEGVEIINHEDAYLEQGNRITERLGTDRYDGVESLTLKGHFELNRFMDFTTVLQIYEGAKYWQVTVSAILAVALLAMIFLYIRKK